MQKIMIELWGVNSHFIFRAPIDKPELVTGILEIAKEAISIMEIEYDEILRKDIHPSDCKESGRERDADVESQT